MLKPNATRPNDLRIAIADAHKSAAVLDAIAALQSALEAAGDPYPFVTGALVYGSTDEHRIDVDATLDVLRAEYAGYLAGEHGRIRELAR